MNEARRDPLTGRWVIVAPGRAGRPDTTAPGPAPPSAAGAHPVAGDECPFCPGHEHLTPPEIARTGAGDPGGPGWHTRVVPNRYPIVAGPAGAAVSGHAAGDVPRRERRLATGAHEVVVLSPDHARSLGALDPDRVVEVLTVLRDRVQAQALAGHTFAQAIVNHGAAGGASLPHPHAQVVAADLTPPEIVAEIARVATGRDPCLICAEAGRQRDEDTLLIGSPGADLWCPWWSSAPYEMLLAPRRHSPSFEEADDELPAVGRVLHEGLARLGRLLGDPPYNLAVHSRPPGLASDFHWHVHVWPRLQRDGGFERATGVLVTVVDPADATRRLRSG